MGGCLDFGPKGGAGADSIASADTVSACLDPATDCPAPGDPCSVAVCLAGACAAEPRPSGTSCGQEPCRSWSCDDSGECVAGPTTTAGAPCSSGDVCLEGGVCGADGSCVETFSPSCECSDSAQCEDGRDCTTGSCEGASCVYTPSDGHCLIGDTCYDHDDAMADNTCQRCDAGADQRAWTSTDGAACDDGKACNGETDVCHGGVCGTVCECYVSSDCEDATPALSLGPCQRYACDTGACVPKADEALAGATCDTGDPCLVNAMCQGGECQGEPACGAEPCPSTCAPDGQQGFTCSPDDNIAGSGCDDGNSCTQGDVCAADGSCAGVPLDCSAFDVTCLAGVCDNGACTAAPLLADSTCGFAHPSGVGSAVGACDGEGTCETDVYDCGANDECSALGLGACLAPSCSGGTCSGIILNWCLIDGECHADGVHHDDNQCLVCDVSKHTDRWSVRECDGTGCAGACDAQQGCDTIGNEGQSCSPDGTSCPIGSCSAGTCKEMCECTDDTTACGPPPQCEKWSCNNYQCVAVADAVQDNQGCDDGDFCTPVDICQSGTCGPPDGTITDCSAFDGDCVVGVCEGDAQACVPVPLGADTPCLGDGCFQGQTCDGAGECVGGTPLDCGPGTPPCVVLECVAGQCVLTDTSGIACEDGNTCTVGDMCSGDAVCVAGGWDSSLEGCECQGTDDCTVHDTVCTTFHCEEGSCTPDHKNGDACNDNDACTESDTCNDGACVGAQLDCDDGLSCTVDSCVSGTCDHSEISPPYCAIDGACYVNTQPNPTEECQLCDLFVSNDSWAPKSDIPCDDGVACTNNDTCTAGSCSGDLYLCPDLNLPCASNVCGGEDGCRLDVDAGYCAIGGACYLGGDHPPGGNTCLVCDPDWPSKWSYNNGAACSDGDNCTQSDACLDGACQGSPKDCDDQKSCTQDTCQLGICVFGNITGCLIGGECYKDGDLDPDNPCQVCDPGTSKVAWTNKNSGEPCDIATCESEAQCDASGNCVCL